MDYTGWIAEFGGKMPEGYFRRNQYFRHDANYLTNKWNVIKDCQNTDVYECAYKYENTEYNTCKLLGEPYLDFDIDDIQENYDKLVRGVKYVVNYIENIMGIRGEELRLYFSGHKGFHLIIPGELIGITPSATLNEDFKYFAMGMAFLYSNRVVQNTINNFLDLGIYDRKRLFRIVNSVNSKSKLRKVPVTIDQLYDFHYEDMIKWAGRGHIELPRKCSLNIKARKGYKEIIDTGKKYERLRDGKNRRKKKRYVLGEGELLELLPCTKNLLETGAVKGNRNQALFALASSLAQSGYKSDTIYDMAEEWNSRNEEPLSDHEIQTTVNSAINSYESGMTVGCGRYKELGYCQDDCKLR